MKKDTVEDTNQIAINWLMRDGKYKAGSSYFNCGITWTKSGAWGESKNSISYDLNLSDRQSSIMNFFYYITDRHTREKTKYQYDVTLTTTACNFGSFRYWFICPGINCGKRVGVLYFGSKYFLCRHCLNLTYRNQNGSKKYRALSKLFSYDDKFNEISKKIYRKYGRKFYKGKPSRKYCKLIWYNNNLGFTQNDYSEIDRFLNLLR
jgi:hypothetical protein